MADYSKLTKKELIMTLYARDLMLENERKRLEHLTEKYFELKQQLHDLPNKIVEEIRIELNNIVEVGDYFDTETDEETNLLKQSDIENILDTILKKFGAEDESNND